MWCQQRQQQYLRNTTSDRQTETIIVIPMFGSTILSEDICLMLMGLKLLAVEWPRVGLLASCGANSANNNISATRPPIGKRIPSSQLPCSILQFCRRIFD